jgi:hypothetical protein
MLAFYQPLKLWLSTLNPDNDVRDNLNMLPSVGDIFTNITTKVTYECMQTGANNQIWNQTITYPQVTSLLLGSQSDWTQSSNSDPSYIKNKPSLASVATTGSYSDLSNRPSIPSAQVNTDWNSSSGVSQLMNKPTLASVATSGSYSDLSNKPTIPSAQIQSDWTQANTNALDYIKNKPASFSQSAVTRSLNSAFQVSPTRLSEVRYSVDISTTVSLTGGAVGRVILEMATNSAFTTGVQELQSFGNGNTGTIVVGLVLTQLSTACLSGKVPAGNYVRLRTVNVTGSPTYTYQSGQEILM